MFKINRDSIVTFIALVYEIVIGDKDFIFIYVEEMNEIKKA
jgi:hypothetical protein